MLAEGRIELELNQAFLEEPGRAGGVTLRRSHIRLRMEIVLAASAALILGMPLTEAVSAAADTTKCTLKTLTGTYVLAAHGVLNDGTSVLPYADAGTWTLDGSGHAQGVFSASVNGTTILDQEAFTATYRHEAGCVFTPFAPVGNDVLEFHLYATTQGATMTYFTAGVSGTQFGR
ncbi:MAG: hypothetical protein LC797_15330 [Chloroflexi bacterium]|nr:hypothetical protein [Chloroflexota bacterium]